MIDRDGVVRYHGAPDGDHDDPAPGRRAGCATRWTTCWPAATCRRPATSPAGCSMKWRVELLWWDGCPTHGEAADLLRDTLDELGRADVHVVRARRCAPARRPSGSGSPARPPSQVGRRDLFPNGVGARADLPRVRPRRRPQLTAARRHRPRRPPPRRARPPVGPARLGRPPQARDRRSPSMASITYDRITKRYPDGTQAVADLDLDDPRRRVPRPRRPVRLRQDDRAAHGRRPRGDLRRPAARRRPRRQRRAPRRSATSRWSSRTTRSTRT